MRLSLMHASICASLAAIPSAMHPPYPFVPSLESVGMRLLLLRSARICHMSISNTRLPAAGCSPARPLASHLPGLEDYSLMAGLTREASPSMMSDCEVTARRAALLVRGGIGSLQARIEESPWSFPLVYVVAAHSNIKGQE